MRNSQNAKHYQGTSSELPSLTVPDQSLTLRELLTNYTRGQELPINKAPAFFDETEFIPNLKKMDLVDIQELKIANAKKAGELKRQIETPSTVIHQPIKTDEETSSTTQN